MKKCLQKQLLFIIFKDRIWNQKMLEDQVTILYISMIVVINYFEKNR